MDPDESLRVMREASEAIELGDLTPEELEETALDMVQHFEALDDWLRRGGFLPVNWKRQIGGSSEW